ncbi:MAG TPA: DUF5916 domain-containing protein [Vicinamibacteria bacterium]|nr:DUF5916 domain-containing protein [Vicinamibacteria bacterium]
MRRVLVLGLAGLAAVGPSAAAAAGDAPRTVAVRLALPPRLDGDVLGDPAWTDVPAASDFWQTTPYEGRPASERTELRVGYTADTLYLGIVCFDRDPAGIIVSGTRRDSPLEDTDSVQILLDTYRDRQNGFVFGTNPAGIEYDGQVSNEGRGNQSFGFSLGGFNLNWDGSWEVRTASGELGWSAEFAIPFRTLRYAAGSRRVWGLNVQRNIRRRNEQAFWAPLTRQHDLYRVSAAGSLEGLELPPQRNLKLTPYLLGEAQRDRAAGLGTRTDGDVGGDLKWSLAPSLTLDATVNTDFAQVEVDEQQINLDRFNLFFPEKRPFFLENAGLFTFGTPGEVEAFFSRRIGIGPEGEVIPILGGGRLSGKVRGFDVGLLEMQTRAEPGVAPASNFAVGRLYRELPNRTGLGAIFVNRQATGELARPGDRNRTLGVDGRWGLGRYLDLAGYAARTFTPGLSEAQHALNLGATWHSPAWELFAKYTDVAEGFNPEAGFLRRRGYRKPEAQVFHTHRVKSFLGLLEARPHASYRGFWKPDGFQESGFLHVDNHLEWKSGHEFHTGMNFTTEGLRQPFEIYPGVVVPPGTYRHAEVLLVGRTNRGAPASLELSLTAGGFFGGSRVTLDSQLQGRAGEALNAFVDWTRNDVSLPGGRFVTNLVRGRLSYSFTPRLYLQGLLQYNDRIDNWSLNLRLGWLQSANTGLFLVLNENRDTTPGGLGLRDRSLTLKFSRLFDLLD